jgi:K+ transporter
MVIHLWRVSKLKPGETMQGLETTLEYNAHWRKKIVISAIGAFVTGIVMIVFTVTKFTSGAWFVVLLIPALVFVFSRIHNHYRDVAKSLSLAGKKPDVQTRPCRP